jgi:hypothetical protein
MGHSVELLQRIGFEVAKSWPSNLGYRLVFEKPIPGFRMFPDIQVLAPDGKVCCAVEIGYTRPEKLTTYRLIGIGDVRWYDKQGVLHGDVNESSAIVYRKVKFQFPEALRFKQLNIYDRVVCYCCVHGEINETCKTHEGEDCDCEPRAPLSFEEYFADESKWEKALDEHRNTLLTVVSNGSHFIPLFFCDECGLFEILNDPVEFEAGTGLESAIAFEREFLRRGRRECLDRLARTRGEGVENTLLSPELSYEQVVELAQKHFGLEISYDDFQPWET